MYEAAFLTRCYIQDALHPLIDSEIYHQRHFIKIPFIDKGIGLYDLHNIFQDNSVTSSIPDYFQNSEPMFYYCNKWAKMCLVKLFMAPRSKMGFGYIVGKLII